MYHSSHMYLSLFPKCVKSLTAVHWVHRALSKRGSCTASSALKDNLSRPKSLPRRAPPSRRELKDGFPRCFRSLRRGPQA